MFPYKDIIIDQMINEGYSIKDICNRINTGTCFSRKDVEENYNRTIEAFCRRDECWDIHIMEYITGNYKNEKIMMDWAHANRHIMSIIAQRLLGMLGTDDTDVKFRYTDNSYEMPIYPEVIKYLGLSFVKEKQSVRDGSFYNFSSSMDLEEYVKQYVYWCYDRHRGDNP